MKSVLQTALFSLLTIAAFGQKKVLDHPDFDLWKTITESEISPDGKFIVYHLTPGEGDAVMKIATADGKEIASIPRGVNSSITWDSRFVIFKINPQLDTVKALRRIKTKEDKLPKDSLGIYDLKSNSLEKIARVKSYNIPKEWPNILTYQLEAELPKKVEKDTVAVDSVIQKKKVTKPKPVNKKNGYPLVVRDLIAKTQDTIPYVTDYTLAKRSDKFIYQTTGRDSTILEGIYYYNQATHTVTPLCRTKGKYAQLAIAEDGLQTAFLSDLDTTKALIRDFQLRYWNQGKDSAMVIAQTATPGIPENWLVNENGSVNFSKSGSKLFFGTSPKPIVQDTTLLPEEIINVEVWSYKDSRLQTQQNIELEADKKKSYPAYFDTVDENIIQLGTEVIPDLQLADHGDAPYALGLSNIPYQKYISWEGFPQRYDVYSINVKTGEATQAIQDLRGNAGISAEGEYLYWYNAEDTTWYSYSNADKKVYALTKTITESMADERNDQPNYPYQYGAAGWTTGDQNLLVYDRYDIWKLDPTNGTAPVNLTNGRASKTVFRNQDLDRDEEALTTDLLLFHTFNETDKSEGYVSIKDFGKSKLLIKSDARFARFRKAKNSATIMFTRESNEEFPDLLASDLSFKKISKISNANPQQKDYAWGSVELYNWNSMDGVPLQGLLYKPANFDPNKKYPMIVNFYERDSDDLHNHWGVKPHRSIVNAAFYASRGYLVFNPDVAYKEGYPGESAYNSVVAGTTALIKEGFVQADKIGLQGHSWGGYQIAYLVTQTNLFACAEAGAIVSNMISAYGGIRWWTGLSRMFQYEHTQSRIGGTLWEYPLRYIENSPIFYADKVETPLLLMANDADGHVPWYQGIEYYVALRRLGKPVWMLNYSGEPHWPTKWQNIRDFNVRMSQFFDHYLKDAPMPVWMGEGIPAIEKGINKGTDLMDH